MSDDIKETHYSAIRTHAAFTSSSVMPTPIYSTISWMDYRYGSTNSRWRTQVREKKEATTTLIAQKSTVTMSDGYYMCARTHLATGAKYYGGAIGLFCGLPIAIGPGAVDQGNAANVAASQWYKKVRNAMSTFKGSVFAAEARDAQRMMWTRATSMLSMINPYQRRVKKRWQGRGSRRAKLKSLSDSWLELQFGWLPLASDLEDAYKVLQTPQPQYKRVSAFSAFDTASPSNRITGGLSLAEVEGTYSESTQYYVKYYGEVRARRDPTGDKLLDFGLGVREFLPTAWEVIPWSFAVDYFTNVSDIVTALSYASSDVTRCSRLVRAKRVRKAYASCSPVSWGPGYLDTISVNIPASYESVGTSINRTPGVQVPIPSLEWQLPSWKQALNLTALAVSRRLRLFY